MTRVTRSRRVVSSNDETDVQTNSKRKVAEKVTKISTRVTKRGSKQDENAVPDAKTSKIPVSKSKVGVLGSKLHSVNKDNSFVQTNTILAMKSPVLRDRTNTSNDLIQRDVPSKKKVQTENIKTKPVQKPVATRKTVKNSAPNKSKGSIEKFVVKSKVNPKKSDSEQVVKNISKESKEVEKVSQNEHQEQELISKNKKVTSPSSNRASRKMNMSVEDVEKLLNDDDDDNNDDDKGAEDNENIEPNRQEVEKEMQNHDLKTKKFFKYKSVEREIQPPVQTKKNTRKPVNNRKKIGAAKRDSTFSPKVDEPRKSRLPEKKNLRAKSTKNYCEESKLISTPEEKSKLGENPAVDKDQKGIPIYNMIRSSQEHKDNGEEVYAFPDDSQEILPKGKKRKKTVKRAAPKRPRKAATIPSKKPVKKPVTKNIPRNVQFTDQPEDLPVENINTNIEEQVIPKQNAAKPPIVIPEHLLNAGESTFEEASTLKIVSDKPLNGSSKIHLMATPNVPKTINSELKLYGTKNPVTSQPTTQYNNMVNHSLIRKSMSPITKISNEFDAGSPWRPVETFSRIQKMVQSTPQINRLPLNREKKLPLLKKKSISSEETIHNSATAGDKLSNTPSPRKFGTVISNTSPSSNTKSPTKATSMHSPGHVNIQKSPLQATSPQATSPEIPMDDMSTVLVDESKKLQSPNISMKKKVNTPSPFRFERIRSSKRLASVAASPSKSVSQNIMEDFEPEAGPSWIDKPVEKPRAVLVQTNLNNFLNKDEMPQPACIKTYHGIFNDIHSTPIAGKKPRKLTDEPNIENAFGFDDCDLSEMSSVVETGSTSKIATEIDVKNSKKGKVFPKARVKSAVPSRISENTVKKTLLRNIAKKAAEEKVLPKIFHEDDENTEDKENDEIDTHPVNNYEPNQKKAVLDAVSFSDTFDVLSENGEDLQSKVPESMPLFVDLEPVHFSKPPRRSYNKRKRAVQFDTSMEDFWEDEEQEKQKPKKKKENKLNKEDQKRMQQWVKSINRTFDEIEHFDLVVE